MIHPILFTFFLVYASTPNVYEITPRPSSGYDVVAIDALSGGELGRFEAGEYEVTDGRYTFRAYGDPTWDDADFWFRVLKGHDAKFWLCSQTGIHLMWIEGENIHLMRMFTPE